eukprot:8920385-Alexandrium_andersonii.AAC.1
MSRWTFGPPPVALAACSPRGLLLVDYTPAAASVRRHGECLDGRRTSQSFMHLARPALGATKWA